MPPIETINLFPIVAVLWVLSLYVYSVRYHYTIMCKSECTAIICGHSAIPLTVSKAGQHVMQYIGYAKPQGINLVYNLVMLTCEMT